MTYSPYNPPGARVDDIVKRRAVAEKTQEVIRTCRK